LTGLLAQGAIWEVEVNAFSKSTLFSACAVILILAVAPATAASVNYTAQLSSKEEVPPNDSAGTGSVEATLDTDTKAFSWNITYSGLTGPATAAHFHGPAAVGANAGPVVPIEGDLASPIAGNATLTDAQIADLDAGMWYFNVHTAQYPDGEIRGQLTKQ
jgi:hypothetical protein